MRTLRCNNKAIYRIGNPENKDRSSMRQNEVNEKQSIKCHKSGPLIRRTNEITWFVAIETNYDSIANNRKFNRHYFSVRSNHQHTCWIEIEKLRL